MITGHWDPGGNEQSQKAPPLHIRRMQERMHSAWLDKGSGMFLIAARRWTSWGFSREPSSVLTRLGLKSIKILEGYDQLQKQQMYQVTGSLDHLRAAWNYIRHMAVLAKKTHITSRVCPRRPRRENP